MNDNNNEEKLYGISTNFIRKLTGLFFMITDEKSSSNIPLKKINSFLKFQH